MRAVLIAAAIAAVAAPAYAGLDNGQFGRPSPFNDLERTQEACNALVQKTAQKGPVQFRRLDQLPRGVVEHAVLRSIGGCPVREVVFRGQVYWVQPSSIPRLERLDPASRQTAPRQK